MSDTKICKYCKTEIPKDAKICPNCRKKQKGKLGLIIGIIVVVLILAAAFGGGKGADSSSNTTPTDKADTTVTKDSTEASEEQATEEKEYIAVTKQELSDALDANALKAADTYKDKYLEVSGYLDNIDSSGDYITINAGSDDYTFVNVQCYIKNDDQKAIIMEMNSGDPLTIKGKCTDVGEFLGYSISIEEIITE